MVVIGTDGPVAGLGLAVESSFGAYRKDVTVVPDSRSIIRQAAELVISAAPEPITPGSIGQTGRNGKRNVVRKTECD